MLPLVIITDKPAYSHALTEKRADNNEDVDIGLRSERDSSEIKRLRKQRRQKRHGECCGGVADDGENEKGGQVA